MSLDLTPSGFLVYFVEKVQRRARLYQTRDRSDMAKVLESQRQLFDSLREQVQEAGAAARPGLHHFG